MKFLRINKAWWAMLPVAILVLGPLMVLFPVKAAAATRIYTFTDSKQSGITGPSPSWVDHGNDVTYKKSGSGIYTHDYNNGLGTDGCDHANIKLTGGGTGDLYESGCDNASSTNNGISPVTTRDKGTIQIADFQTKTGTWIDHSHITVDGDGGGAYFDGKIDDTVSFQITGASGCSAKNKIDGFAHSGSGGDGKNSSNASSSADIHIFKQSTDPGNTSCLETVYPISFTSPSFGNYNKYFRWVDAGTITTSDGQTIFQQKQSTSGGDYFGPTSGSCSSYITASSSQLSGSDPSTGTLVIQTPDANPFHEGFPDGKDGDTSGQHIGDWGSDSLKFHKSGNCNVSDPIKIAIADPVGADGKTPASSQAAGSGNLDNGNSDNGSTPSLGCHIGFNLAALNPLNWLVCGIIAGLSSIVGELDGAITSQLSVGTPGNSDQPSQIFCDTGVCNAYHDAWASFRNIALGLMVIAGLIIVISQALDMEILDAYTIRKTLPRVLVAALGITLSWPLMKFFVTLTNDLGYGIRHLIYAPFNNAGLSSATINLGSTEWNATSLVAGIGAIAFGSFGILTFVGTAALALLIAFTVLVLRQIAIIMLIILAPIAIVAYILPNTQKMYKFWWESFSKALLMFPLIAGFIAAGHVFSVVAASNNKNDVLSQMVAFFAYFAPYFMIPLTFKFAGAALGQLGGFVNDRSRGGFDRLRKARQENTQKRFQKLGEGKLLHQDTWNPAYNAWASRFNRASRGTANLKNAGMNPVRMRSRMASARSITRMQNAMRDLTENKDVAEALKDDDIAEGIAFGAMDDRSFRSYLTKRNEDLGLGLSNDQIEQKVAMARMVRQNTAPDTTRLTAWLANTRTHTGFDDKRRADGSVWTGAEQMQESLTDIVGADDDLMLRALGQGRDFMMEKGRVDAAGMSYSEQAKLYRDVQSGLKPGGAELGSRVKAGAIFGQSRGRLIGSSPRALENIVPELQANFDQIVAEGGERDLMEELAMAGAGQQVAGQVSKENAQKHARYMNHEVKLGSLPADMDAGVRQAIERAAEYKRRTTGGPVDRVTVQDMLDANSGNRELTANVYRYGQAWDAERIQRGAATNPGDMIDPTRPAS